jgi:NADP-dependent 3-hydroxy acid dehydrogenase YdfG
VPDSADPLRLTAVVTGASSGIGAATARALAEVGYEVVIGARRVDRLEALATEIGGRAHVLDVTDDASVTAFAATVPTCSVLVNNAGGAFGFDRIEDADLDQWQAMYDTNVLGTLRTTKAMLPALRASARSPGSRPMPAAPDTPGQSTQPGRSPRHCAKSSSASPSG